MQQCQHTQHQHRQAPQTARAERQTMVGAMTTMENDGGENKQGKIRGLNRQIMLRDGPRETRTNGDDGGQEDGRWGNRSHPCSCNLSMRVGAQSFQVPSSWVGGLALSCSIMLTGLLGRGRSGFNFALFRAGRSGRCVRAGPLGPIIDTIAVHAETAVF